MSSLFRLGRPKSKNEGNESSDEESISVEISKESTSFQIEELQDEKREERSSRLAKGSGPRKEVLLLFLILTALIILLLCECV